MKEQFGLYLILTDPIVGYETCAQAAVEHGIRYLQLRMKGHRSETILQTACKLRKITEGTKTKLIINDCLETAMRSNADGVHLGQGDLSPENARNTWKTPGKIIGLSTHTVDQAELASTYPVDYVGIGPVYPTATKKDTAPVLGVDAAGCIAKNTTLTSVAIGGINESNLPDVLLAGFRNYCVVSAVNHSSDPAGVIQILQNIWKKHYF